LFTSQPDKYLFNSFRVVLLPGGYLLLFTAETKKHPGAFPHSYGSGTPGTQFTGQGTISLRVAVIVNIPQIRLTRKKSLSGFADEIKRKWV